MALLLPSFSFSAASSLSPLPPSYPPNGRPALSLHVASSLSSSLKRKHVFGPTLPDGAGFSLSCAWRERRLMMIACASSQTDGRDAEELPVAPSDESDVTLLNLPLESKLQMKLDQKLKMKLAKKIRLRRKRLLRKRKLRKKGRWPPSKMKKLKNV